MPKKKSSKVSTVTKEPAGAGQEKQPSTSKDFDIDEIFATLKRKRSQKEKAGKTGGTSDKPKNSDKKKRKVSKEIEPVNPDPKPRRRTNDGLTIYTEEELGLSKQDAGGTGLCPFDCSCCF